MTHRKVITTGLLLFLFIATACSFSAPLSILRVVSQWMPATPTTTPAPTTAVSTPQPQVYQITRAEESDDATYIINITHPELDAGDTGDNFNYVVEQLLVAQMEYFKANVALIQDGESDAGISTLQLDFNLYRQDNRFISLLFIEDIYYAGAVHPGRTHYALNYSLPESRFYELADLFLPNSPYIFALSQYAFEELQYTFGEENVFAAGISPVPDNFARWNITPNGLLITFEEYQVTAYAAGSPQILVPYSVLELYIDPAGPLGNYLTDQQLDF